MPRKGSEAERYMIPLFSVNMAPGAVDAVAGVMRSGYIGQGDKVKEFEQRLGRITGANWLTTNSCTSAIDLALHLIGVGPGDIVVSTPMTCTATNSPIVTRGARIAWADVDPLTGCIDADNAIEIARITGARAIIAVDWAGRLCDYDRLKSSGVPVIQDAAHVSPWRFDPDRRGDYSCLSFQAIKFVTCGDGGALSVPAHQYERAKLLRWYGLDRESSKSFRCEQDIGEVGYKYHMNDIAAAMGLANIQSINVSRNKVCASLYDMWLGDINGDMLPPTDNGCSYWLYCLLVPDRDEFIKFMAESGIECSPVHARNDRHSAFIDASVNPDSPRPGLDSFASCEVAIPCGGHVSGSDAYHIANSVREWFGYDPIK